MNQKNLQCDTETVIYTTYIALKNGKRLYASQYGRKAFRIVIKKPH